ncbi:MAG: hypothetical protein FWG90_03665 [Oscillospiraceae bacterium]|nr:hypothetical protein [Oscillospiraceae bacterium]
MVNHMSPFNGNFFDSNGEVRNIDSLFSGTGNSGNNAAPRSPFYVYYINVSGGHGAAGGGGNHNLAFTLITGEKIFESVSNVTPGMLAIALTEFGATSAKMGIPANGIYGWVQNNGSTPNFRGNILRIWGSDSTLYVLMSNSTADDGANLRIEERSLGFMSFEINVKEEVI